MHRLLSSPTEWKPLIHSFVHVLGVKKLLLFCIVHTSKSKETDLAQIYTVNGWIVYNFVGLGLDAQHILGCSE